MASEVLFQLAAGGDTASGSIRATFLYVLSNTRVHRRLITGIDKTISAGRVSEPISNEQALELLSLQAVMKEGLRIHSPSSGLLMKSVPK